MMKYSEKISFVLAAYNEEMYIEACIESCFSQTYSNVEVCVTDDGSTDGTWMKLKKLKADHPNLKIHKFEKNRGKIAAFNQSRNLATGKYIAIMGADDVCMPDRIEQSLNQIGTAALLFTNLSSFNEDGVVEESIMSKSGYTSSRYVKFEELLLRPIVFGGTIFASAEIMDKIFPIDERFTHEDWWIALCAASAGQVKYCDFISVGYRKHSQQTSSNNVYLNGNFVYWKNIFSREVFYYETVLSNFRLSQSQELSIKRKLIAARCAAINSWRARMAEAVSILSPRNWDLRVHLWVLSPYFCFRLAKARRRINSFRCVAKN
jgi:glycosyltransferase involved in cell wall biosynthesis